MDASPDWQRFLVLPDEAAASPVVEYLRLHDCPALVFFLPPRCDFRPAVEVRVPPEFLSRARDIWAQVADLTEGELQYLATGELPGPAGPRRQDDAA